MSAALKIINRISPNILNNEVSRVEAVLEGMITPEDLNRLVLNHSQFQSEAARTCGVSLNTFKERVAEAIEKGIIPEVIQENNKYRYTLNHIHALMDWMKCPKWADKKRGCIVLDVQNQKGGSGKSTTVISLAAGIALNVKERRRVLVIDLDPQGTLRVVAAPDLTAAPGILSAVDIMLGADEPDSDYSKFLGAGYSEEQILNHAIKKTHIPNLDIIPAFPTDERFSSAAWFEFAKSGELRHLNLLKDKIINPLKNDYDMILIDTGPHVNPLTWSALEACNAMLIPVTPRKLDWASTGQFIMNLPDQFKFLPSKGENIKFLKVAAVNYDEEQNRDLEMLNQMKIVLGGDMLNPVIKRSTAFESASRNYRTVYDLRKSDNLCPERQLDKAISSLNDVTRELLISLNEIDFN